VSHYSRIKTKIKSKGALVKALQDMGFRTDQIEVHDQAIQLEGYEARLRKETAEVIIRRRNVGGASNDIGFKRMEDGTFEAIVSAYDKGNGASRKNKLTTETRGYSGRWMELLSQRYSFRVIEEQANIEGFSLEERWENGEIVVEASRDY
jgi:hypothetical protein